MAEAIAILGALSSCLQVIDFSAKLVRETHSLISSGDETRKRNKQKDLALRYTSLGEAAKSLDSASLDLAGKTEVDQLILRLGEDCVLESTELWQQLDALKLEDKTTGLKRLVDGTKKAAKGLSQAKEILQRRTRLQELNSQLSTAILQSLYAKQELLTAPGISVLHAVNQSSRDPLDQIATLRREHQTLAVQTHRILDSLHFDAIQSREISVQQAYHGTYTWAITDDKSALKKWLRSGEGVFWVQGKAGSGKSTLMKHVATSLHTKAMLREWCGQAELVTTSFYFWYAGTTLQKSITGLLRSILYQIIGNDKDLAQLVFPDSFDMEVDEDLVKGTRSYRTSRIVWSHVELVDALIKLIQCSHGIDKAKRFCFFIDGLDEFQGDQMQLISLLRGLAAIDGVKLCLASRPWNAFSTAFETGPNLRLEALSRPDILRYVEGHVRTAMTGHVIGEATQEAQDSDAPCKIIVEKAEGVFLWVYLVVLSVIRGLAEGDNFSMLLYRVEQFPPDLEDFFRNILDRVDSIYAAQTSQALKLAYMYAVDADHGGMAYSVSHFVDYWLIRQSPKGLSDPQFPYKTYVRRLSPDQIATMKKETRSMLRAACKDLLMLPEDDSPESTTDVACHRVQFLHRTVFDFLSSDEMQLRLTRQVPTHFKSESIFYLLNLARMKWSISTLDALPLHRIWRDTSIMSLSSAHAELNVSYAAEFEKALLATALAFESTPPSVLSGLIAFRQRDWALGVVELDNSGYMDLELDDRRLILLAALGEDGRNKFDLCQVDIMLIRSLLESNYWMLSFHEPNDPPGRLELSKQESAWQIFGNKWKAQHPCTCPTEQDRESHLRGTWEIAKLLLRDAPSSKVFDPKHRQIADFMLSVVPHGWLLKCGATRSWLQQMHKSNERD
ncbi:hypothetical protein LTR78_001336 [Recurvomyces mirabilis]|uniref:NACHT domain-containing protein n=1 Tax=Recurvomyces mirabilis TaxID=574656 RepID=A0AAE1C5J3_9PEZI|nr:hypothetical protein LTR78_001336 [Recurvomyces mirabilis]KAK5161313.1 hypothetical protein LTS14_001109 [Recurvomyces mirabilis]